MAFEDTETIIQFACLFGVFIIWFLTLVPIRMAQGREREYNKNNPRAQMAQLDEAGQRAVGAQMAQLHEAGQRAVGAQMAQLDEAGQRAVATNSNTLEALVLFTAAVLVNYIGRGQNTAGTVLCIIFLIVRIIYPFFYYYSMSSLRSLVWSVGLLSLFALFILPFATPN